MNQENRQGLGVGKLTLFAVGTTLASGVFSYPVILRQVARIRWQP